MSDLDQAAADLSVCPPDCACTWCLLCMLYGDPMPPGDPE